MENQVILITGASKGIGAMMSKNFARNGFKVALNYSKSKDAAELICSGLANENLQALPIEANVSKEKEVKNMFNEVLENFGKITHLVNNAGINLDKPFTELTFDDFDKVIKTNLYGTFLCSREFAKQIKNGKGTITNLGAYCGLQGRKNGSNYCASKAGIMSLTKCMARELAPNIRVNCVIPGFVETDELIERYDLTDMNKRKEYMNRIPLENFGTEEQIYSMINYLITEGEYITGQNLFVNGGNYMG